MPAETMNNQTIDRLNDVNTSVYQNTKSKMDMKRLVKQVIRQLSQPDSGSEIKTPSPTIESVEELPFHQPVTPTIESVETVPFHQPVTPTIESVETVPFHHTMAPKVETGVVLELSPPNIDTSKDGPLHEPSAPSTESGKVVQKPKSNVRAMRKVLPLQEPTAPSYESGKVLPLQEPTAPNCAETGKVVAIHVHSEPKVDFGIFISGPHHQIVGVIPNSYCDKLGLRKGDRLFSINERNLHKLSTCEVVREFKDIQHESNLVILRQKIKPGNITNDNDSVDGTRDNSQDLINRDHCEEICVKISLQTFQELIIPLDDISGQTVEVRLKHKKSYNAYVKSISCSNKQTTDACWKYEENNVIAAPIQREQIELWQCKIHLYKTFEKVDGQPCVLQVGPDGFCIACWHDNRTGRLRVYPTPDYRDPLSLTTTDQCVFYKRSLPGDSRVVFQSSIMPSVYLCMEETTLVAMETCDVEELGNIAMFDIETFKTEKVAERSCILEPFRFFRRK